MMLEPLLASCVGGFRVPPDTRTPLELTASVLMMALWPDRFWIKLPSGNIHCLMLSAEPEANVYLKETKYLNK